jgi:hypothetical protein
MSNHTWRRELAHGLDQDVTVPDGGLIEKTKKESWNLICLQPPADMSESLAIRLWPDLAPGRFRSDFWYVERLRLKTIGNSEHVMAEVDLSLKGRSEINDPNPLRRPLSFEMETDYIEVPTEVDGDGNPILNAAGDQITGIVNFEPILIFTGVRYITSTPAWLNDFAEKCVNSSPIEIDGFPCEPETVKMEGLTLGPIDYAFVDDKTIRFREMPLKLMYKKTTWKDEYLNQGFNEWIPPQNPIFATNLYQIPGRRIPCVDSTGKPVEKAVPLTKDGARIRETVTEKTVVGSQQITTTKRVIKEFLSKDDLNYISVQRNKKLDFNLLFT